MLISKHATDHHYLAHDSVLMNHTLEFSSRKIFYFSFFAYTMCNPLALFLEMQKTNVLGYIYQSKGKFFV